MAWAPKLLVDEVEGRSIEDCKLCEYVNQKMKFLTRYHVMRAIRKEAEHDLEALRHLCGNAIWEHNTELSSIALRAGYQGRPGARKFRVLVPLRWAVQVFEGASVDHFRRYGTVRCNMAELP